MKNLTPTQSKVYSIFVTKFNRNGECPTKVVANILHRDESTVYEHLINLHKKGLLTHKNGKFAPK